MALTDKLTSIANAIREKGGTTDKLTLDAMPNAIAAIETGGGSGEDGVPNPIVIKPISNGIFANNNLDWILENYGDRVEIQGMSNIVLTDMFKNTITTKPLIANYPITLPTSATYFSTSNMFNNTNVVMTQEMADELADKMYDPNRMFYEYKGETIPSLTFYNGTTSNFNQFINNSPNVKEIGTIYNMKPSGYCSNLFAGNSNVREYKLENFDFTSTHTQSLAYLHACFSRNYSLRTVDTAFLKEYWNNKTTNNQLNSTFEYCASLDEVVGLSPQTETLTSNGFRNTFIYCYRLKNIIFDTQDDGTPYIAEWKNQTIDLSIYVGWAGYSNADKDITTNYNSGITADKEVTSKTTYNALKDDPDWWSRDFNFSRFNHDSAVAMINSLPDTSAYLATQTSGTNTIKFYSNAGYSTDGGSVSQLTEEEIAVAAAKGWTISYTV